MAKFEDMFDLFVAYKESGSDAFICREALKTYSTLGDDECELKIRLLELLKECKL